MSSFVVQNISVTCGITVGDKNDSVGDVWTVSIASVEYLCPRHIKSAGRVCVFVAIVNSSNGIFD